MNETVKAALLAERRDALRSVDDFASDVCSAQRRVKHAQEKHDEALLRLNDISAFLRDNGVDLAAVDAEAEKARMPSAMQAYAGIQTGLSQRNDFLSQYGAGQANGDVSNQLRGSLNATQQNDIMIGLARALDQA